MDDSCCDPVPDAALSPASSEELADTFKVLADPVRLRLLSLIASVPEGEVCACDLNEPLNRSQATVSHHLSVLVKAGLISREQRGKWAWFRLAPDQIEFVHSVLQTQPMAATG
ncbi:MAG: metalloregulator ArsR/SmtB family transcription factor [Acidimicrobiia bacterium]|nr:metalloregulator ArsR/SmtB family transcription factor [Acidimicrobiia bacterium]